MSLRLFKKPIGILFFLLLLASAGSVAQHKPSLVIAVPDKLSEINPFFSRSTFSANITDIIYDQLVMIDAEGKIVGGLAQNWSVSKDRLTWTFTLKDNLKFHDGHPLTAEDVVFSIQSYKGFSQGSIIKIFLDIIDSVKAPSGQEVMIKLNKPCRELIRLLRIINIAPKHLFGIDGYPLDREIYRRQPIGSGAYRIEHISETEVSLKPWSQHRDHSPHSQSITIRITGSEQASLALFMGGQVDIAFNRNSSDFSVTENMPHALQFHYKNNILYALFLNLRHDLFRSMEFRQALNYAVDKPAIIQQLKLSTAVPAANIVDDAGADPQIAFYPYNPEDALELFRKAGWNFNAKGKRLEKGGQPLSFDVLVAEDDSISVKTAQILQRSYEEFGIRLNLVAISLPELMRRLFSEQKFESAIIPFTNKLGIFHHSVFWSGDQSNLFNFTGYNNSKVNLHLDQALYSIDDTAIHAAQRGFQTEFHDDPPLVFLFWKQATILVNKNIVGLDPSPLLFFKKLHLVRKISDDCKENKSGWVDSLMDFFMPSY